MTTLFAAVITFFACFLVVPLIFGLLRMFGVYTIVEEGKCLWQHEIKGEAVRSATALADGSLLVAAGKTLIHLDPAGKLLFLVAVDKDITAPPVVDAEGGIYVAAGALLVKIQ